METPYNKLSKIYTNCLRHMTKITAMPINGKTLKTHILQNQKTGALGNWYGELRLAGLPSFFK